MTGYGVLLRSFLRRDWWQVLAWTVGITILYWSQAVSVDGLYKTQAELDKVAATLVDNSAFIALAGPTRALNTIGGQVFWQASAFGAVLIALMAMFLVGRHTRAEEESSRGELVRSQPVGRYAQVAAAATLAGGACLVVGIVLTVALATYPLAVADSIATGLGLTLVGWTFTGVALLAAQLVGSTRAAYGMTGAAIGVAYGLRAIGDVAGSGLSWLSPIGWYQAMYPFSGLRWWPAGLLVAATALNTAVACAVLVRRDYGAGLLADRPGPARGRLGCGLALAWRLQRSAIVWWAAGLLLGGLAFGSIGNDVGALIGDSATTREVFVGSGDVVDGFYATALLMMALLATGFAISSALRPRGEEDDGTLELLLSTGLSRARWLAGHVVLTGVGAVVVLAAGGLGIGVGYSLATGSWDHSMRFSLPVLEYVAPVFLCAAVAWLLLALVPRAAALAWAVLAWAFVVMMFGPLWSIPDALQRLSPFDALASAPAEPVAALPILTVAVVAAAVTAAAFGAFRRRDIG